MANFYYGKGTDDLWVTFLTHTEERRLFRRFYAGLTKGPNPKDISGDTLTEDAREARDQIITQFLRFCAKYAIRFAKGALLQDEAISTANFGLLRVLHRKKFRPGKNIRFATFLRNEIRGSITFIVRQNRLHDRRMNQVASEVLSSIYDIGDVEDEDSNKLTHRNPRTNWYSSLRPLWVEIPNSANPYHTLELNQYRRSRLHAAFKCLDSRERFIFIRAILRGRSFSSIAQKYNITRQRVGQLVKTAKEKMKRQLQPFKKDLEL